MSGRPTNPEATDPEAVVRRYLVRNIPFAGVREAIAALDALLTERDDGKAYIDSLVRDLRQRTDKCFELKDRAEAAEATLTRYRNMEVAARALYERVEMDESVGICLTDRAESLALGAALAALDGPKEGEPPADPNTRSWLGIQPEFPDEETT